MGLKDGERNASMKIFRACAQEAGGQEIEKVVLTVRPHHWHLIPMRHSADQQLFRHFAHLELLGRFPSWKWWVVPLVYSFRDLLGSYVALSTQLGTANS